MNAYQIFFNILSLFIDQFFHEHDDKCILCQRDIFFILRVCLRFICMCAVLIITVTFCRTPAKTYLLFLLWMQVSSFSTRSWSLVILIFIQVCIGGCHMCSWLGRWPCSSDEIWNEGASSMTKNPPEWVNDDHILAVLQSRWWITRERTRKLVSSA